MRSRPTFPGRFLFLSLVAAILVVAHVHAGMAELGRKGKRTESLELAIGDCPMGEAATLQAGGQSPDYVPVPGDTAVDVLEALAAQLPPDFNVLVYGVCNVGGVTCDPDDPGDPCLLAGHVCVGHLSVQKNGQEVSNVGMENCDSAFGYVEADRSEHGPISVRAAQQTPSATSNDLPNPPEVIIKVDSAEAARVRTDSLGVCTGGPRSGLGCEVGENHCDPGGSCTPQPPSATLLNEALVAELPKGAKIVGSPGNERIQIGKAVSVSWEDTDTGLTLIGAFSNSGVESGPKIPTLSAWGILLLALLLITASLWRIRRRAAG